VFQKQFTKKREKKYKKNRTKLGTNFSEIEGGASRTNINQALAHTFPNTKPKKNKQTPSTDVDTYAVPLSKNTAPGSEKKGATRVSAERYRASVQDCPSSVTAIHPFFLKARETSKRREKKLFLKSLKRKV